MDTFGPACRFLVFPWGLPRGGRGRRAGELGGCVKTGAPGPGPPQPPEPLHAAAHEPPQPLPVIPPAPASEGEFPLENPALPALLTAMGPKSELKKKSPFFNNRQKCVSDARKHTKIWFSMLLFNGVIINGTC